MAEYIDREALLKHYIALAKIDWNNKVSPPSWSYAYKKFVGYLAELPSADVVPKSEVMELSGKYEDLKLKYADLQKDHDELIAWGGHIKSTERAEIEKAVARKIFGEIDTMCIDLFGNFNHKRFAELKKKYTKGADNE